MQFRCPKCRRATHVANDLVEHLARCERCGALLHVRARPAASGAWTLAVEAIPRPPLVQARWTPTGLFSAPARARWPGPASAAGGESMGDPLAELVAAQQQMTRPRRRRRSRRSLKARVLGLLTMGLLTMLLLAAPAGGLLWLKSGAGVRPRAAAGREPPSRFALAPVSTGVAAPDAAPPGSPSADGPRGELFPQVRGTTPR